MPTYLLRVEAVNLSNIIDDTDDRSTRRGGGLLLLNAIRQLKEGPEIGTPSTLDRSISDQLKVIDIGASIGLFRFEAPDDNVAEEFARRIRDHFRKITFEYPVEQDPNKTFHLELGYATFVVDFAPVKNGEKSHLAAELATAKNRWRQMCEPSLSLMGLWDEASEPCFVDKTRPANSGVSLPKDENQNRQVSKSVLGRHQYGRVAKRQFYRFEWEALAGKGTYPDYDFTNDFHEIATHPNGQSHPLSNKLAVFYVDGNSFGSKGRKAFRNGSDAFEKWGKGIKTHHREILRDLLTIAAADADWKTGEKIRLETLLWGGDEILFVVPAWKGWELAKWFFGRIHQIDGNNVSYSCGLVFCNAKAPIKDVIHLAKEGLAEEAKDVARKIDQHRLSYAVLESFDNINNLREHRRRSLPTTSTESMSCFPLDPTKLSVIWDSLIRIARSNEFPMRQLYMLCKAWRTASSKEMNAARNRLLACEMGRYFEAVEKELRLDKSSADIISNGMAWLNLLEMLPYIVPPKKEAKP